MCPLLLSALGLYVVYTCADPMCDATNSYVCQSCLLRGPCFLGILHPLGSQIISTSSSMGFSEPSRERFKGRHSILGISIPKSLSHIRYIFSECGFLYLSPSAAGCLSKALICELSRISLGVILPKENTNINSSTNSALADFAGKTLIVGGRVCNCVFLW